MSALLTTCSWTELKTFPFVSFFRIFTNVFGWDSLPFSKRKHSVQPRIGQKHPKHYSLQGVIEDGKNLQDEVRSPVCNKCLSHYQHLLWAQAGSDSHWSGEKFTIQPCPQSSGAAQELLSCISGDEQVDPFSLLVCPMDPSWNEVPSQVKYTDLNKSLFAWTCVFANHKM